MPPTPTRSMTRSPRPKRWASSGPWRGAEPRRENPPLTPTSALLARLRPTRSMPIRFTAVLSCALLAACGSDPAPNKSTQAGSSGEVLDEVLDACTAFAQRLCESAAPCCEQSAPFVEDDCVSSFVEDVCTPSAQLVASELATYDASAEDDCLAAHARTNQTCVAAWEETVAIRRDIWASCHVVNGKVSEGHTCDTD